MTSKDKIVSALKENSGSYVSGETLSALLGISRAAVSKHVGILKKKGYEIASSPKKGYLLTGTPDLLLPEELRDTLETQYIGKKEIAWYSVTESTNDIAKELASGGAPEGSLVVAEKQTAGRGRRGRTWFSGSGENICMSIILRPLMPPTEASRITLMTAVALSEALIELTDLHCTIKWPNDILVNGKKLAGILTEMSMEMDSVDYVVVGMGLNVNAPPDAFSIDIQTIATSLLIECGKKVSRAKLVRGYLKWFEHYYDIVKQAGFPSVMNRWKELSDIIGRSVTVDVMGTVLSGTVTDVDDDGVLILRDNDGNEQRVISGDVLMSETPQV